MTIRILIVDDHAVMREGVRALLEVQAGFKVLETAADAAGALEAARRLNPDVVVLDISMPEINGIELAATLQRSLPAVRVVMLTMHGGREHVHRALRAGALGYVLKESAADELVLAIRSAQAGRRYLCRRLLRDGITGPGTGRSPLESLSERERHVLQLVVEGFSSSEIAEKASLSAKTVDTYRSRLMQKLGLKNLPSLVKFAIEHGVTPLHR